MYFYLINKLPSTPLFPTEVQPLKNFPNPNQTLTVMKVFNLFQFLALLLLIVVISTPLSAQSDSKKPAWRKSYKEGVLAYNNKEYGKSAALLKAAVAAKPTHIPTVYQAGLASFFYRDYANAKKFFLDVQRSKKGNEKYPLAAYYYGVALKCSGDYGAAIKALDDFAATYPYDDTYYNDAIGHITGCSYALNVAPRNKQATGVENMGMGVNTPDSEQSAGNISPDKMVFTTTTENTVAIKIADKNGKVTEIKADGLSSNLRLGSLTIASNNKTYFTASDGKFKQIYEATLIDGSLTDIKPCSANINGKESANAQDPFITTNERGQETMYFSSDRIGTRGGLDLWVSVNIPGGGWTIAKNLGDQINGKSDEIAPFFDKNTKKIYYSTNRTETIGGFDVYTALGFGRFWNKPSNMSMPINSPADDYYFRLDPEGKKAIVSSNRAGSQTMNVQGATDDLYAVIMQADAVQKTTTNDVTKFKVNGSVMDKMTRNELKGFQISLFQVIDGSPVLVDRSRSDSGYDFTLDKDKVYVIEAETDDIRIETFLIDPTDYTDTEVTRDILVVR
jgi:tetratricopeptide (TPR) repeat protein